MKTVIKTLNKELEFVQNALRVLEDYEVGDCFTINDIPAQKRLGYYEEMRCVRGYHFKDKVSFTGATAKALLARGILEVSCCKEVPLRIKEGVTIKCPINIYRLAKTYNEYKEELCRQIEQAF